MLTHRFARLLGVLATLVLFSSSAAADPIIFSSGHVDIDIGFDNGALGLGWHDHDHDIEYEAGQVLTRFLPASIIARPPGPQFNFLGVGAGQPVWVLPQVQNFAIVWPGIAAEEIPNGIFDNDQLTLELVAVRGPGQYSVWKTDPFGNVQVLLSSFAGVTSLDLPTESHQHFNWALSAPGLYELDLRAFGFINGQLVQSDVTTFFLEAVSPQAVPEPATFCVLAVALAPLLTYRRRCRA